MRLSRFIADNLEAILHQWEDFARSLSRGRSLSIEALRDDAEQMLRFVAADMESEQTPQEEIAKANGRRPVAPPNAPSAAQQHGVARAVERFSLVELVAEYRALRASVIRMWVDAVPVTKESVAQIVRFNEAIDQILAEGVAKFSARLDQEADLFTASIAHDLSNPLNAVAMSARRLVVSANLSSSDRVAVQRIERASERLTTMLEDLRDFTRIRLDGHLSLHRELCDVAELVRNVAAELEPVYPGRRIVVECRGDLMVSVDRKRVYRLLSNLLGNALQHGAHQTDVRVEVAGEADAVTIEVHNSGTAIEADRMKQLFDVPGGNRRGKDAHLGLGLYISSQIVHAHGGDIAGESRSDAGTRFRVRLPRAR
jgi:signal transduction histidine kinase